MSTAPRRVESVIAEPPPPPDFSGPPIFEARAHMGIATAPKDGRWIEVSADGLSWSRVRWYATRIRTGAINWVPVTCWSTSEPSKYLYRFDDPKLWREG